MLVRDIQENNSRLNSLKTKIITSKRETGLTSVLIRYLENRLYPCETVTMKHVWPWSTMIFDQILTMVYLDRDLTMIIRGKLDWSLDHVF